MAINKVILDGSTVLDLTGTTVTADKLAFGETALNSLGQEVTGTSISQAEGSIRYSGSQYIHYKVRDDVVTLFCDAITVGYRTTLTLPETICPGHSVYAPCIIVDEDENTYANGAEIEVSANGTMTITGVYGTGMFCFSFIRGVS